MIGGRDFGHFASLLHPTPLQLLRTLRLLQVHHCGECFCIRQSETQPDAVESLEFRDTQGIQYGTLQMGILLSSTVSNILVKYPCCREKSRSLKSTEMFLRSR
jgi:hypothetical protein